MAGFQNSNKHFTDSSNTNPALTTASTHYSPPQHPTTPTSPAPPLSNTTTSPNNKPNSPRNISIPSTTSTNTQPSNNTSSSTQNSSAGPRSLTSTATQTPPSASGPHSAFTPYNNQAPQHPTPVTTPTTSKSSLPQEQTSAMMTTHLDSNGSTMIYPQHHFANPTTHPFWPSYFGGGNPANGAAVLSTNGGSAFVPAVGYGSAGSGMPQGHTPRPKLTTTIWEDEGTLCYQVDARGICVARRQDNDMINGTKLLNVVGMSRGKRDGILKNEKGRVVVKVGAMHLKGVWITFQRAKTLAAQFKISELLYPLFVDDPSIFLHNSYGPSMSTRIPSIGNGPQSQWRPTHPYANNFNNTPYSPDTSRPWYPYGNGNPIMGNPNVPQGQDHGSSPYPPATGYAERPQHVPNPPAVPIYSNQAQRNHNHQQPHLEDYETGYGLINGQPQGQQGVTVVPGPASEENPGSNGYMRPNNQGLYNIVSTDVSGSPAQSNSPQIIGQKRGFVEEDNDEYNNSNQPSPPLAMHPPPPLNNIAVTAAVNAAAAGSFPSPMNVSSNSSPNNSAFSGWAHSGKRVKYEFPEATTPSSSQSGSPKSSAIGYQLPGLGAGSTTPGATPSTPQGYSNSNLQMVTNAHQSTVLHTPSPDSTPVEEQTRRYDQYRQREDQSSAEEISNNGGWE